MRSFTFPLTASPLALKWIVSIKRVDGTVVRMTDAQRDLTISGNSWTAEPGLTVSNAEYYSDGTVSNAQLAVALRPGGVLTAADLAAGKYRNAAISMQIVNFLSPAIGSPHFIGYVGQTTMNTRGLVTMEARGELILGTTIVVETYQAMDAADLGDFRNHIPILPPDIQRNKFYPAATQIPYGTGNLNLQYVRVRVGAAGNPSDYANLYWECTTTGTTAASLPTYTGNVGDVITDGTAQFTARNAWLRYCQVGSLIDAFHFSVVNLLEPRAVDGYYKQGQALVRSGNGTGLSIEMRDSTQAGGILFSAMPITGLIAPGDWLELIPGYDHTAQMAYAKFNNIANFRGDPFAPAPGAVSSPSGTSPTPGTAGPTGGTGAGATVNMQFGISSPVFQVPAGTPFSL